MLRSVALWHTHFLSALALSVLLTFASLPGHSRFGESALGFPVASDASFALLGHLCCCNPFQTFVAAFVQCARTCSANHRHPCPVHSLE
jgi:hypothetical protein